MLGHGCGVSQFQQFYDKHIEKCQYLPHTYLVSSEGDNREETTQENGY